MEATAQVRNSHSEYFNSSELICTLYIRNLNERVSKQQLKSSIIQLFNTHNLPIRNISIFKNLQLRGQAFVTLYSHADCVRAIDELTTHVLYDKPMDIYFANLNSDVGVKHILKEQDPQNYEEKYTEYLKNKRPLRLQSRSDHTKKRSFDETATGEKKQRVVSSDVSITNNYSDITMSEEEPNEMLLFTNLPPQTTLDHLNALFEKFNGFLAANLVSPRNLALVEFRSKEESAYCLRQLGHSVKLFEDEAESILRFAKR
ncbi:unnamed protein product [Ambrosiozyma monospora]|uniref:Unnamed protein product n=1 Tax=Ambrosiozyma monospora TaxID=43982 RepID=A0ACB5TDH9_AMBMO|nr:unnamed protein product [Ambrosiozyma monospora]